MIFSANLQAVRSPFYPAFCDRDNFWMIENLSIRGANRILRCLDSCVEEMDKEYVVTKIGQDYSDYTWLSGKIMRKKGQQGNSLSPGSAEKSLST